MLRNKFVTIVAAVSVLMGVGAEAKAGVMMEGFYKDVPSPGAGTSASPWWWNNLASKSHELASDGFSAIWIPPVCKGAGGGYSDGYDLFDDYDLGSKNEESTYPTRYGTREQLERLCAMMHANGLQILLDTVENQRDGDVNFNFGYIDAYGNANAGRFPKSPTDFHWSPANIPEDPNVPDPSADASYQFGRDLAPINGGRPSGWNNSWSYVGLMSAGDWVTKALDSNGYRLDDVKGVSTDFLLPFLNYGAMANKYAFGEYYDDNISTVQYWIQTMMQNRVSAFDFNLRDQYISPMCKGNGYYDMSQLDHGGLAGVNPGGAVTFVENHDTDTSNPISTNKILGYALILTTEGYPCVFYRDWSTEPGCYGLKVPINNLVWIHEKLASGSTQQRYKSTNVYAFERMGAQHLLVGLNDNQSSDQYVTVQTGFGNNVLLHDYTGHKPDIYTDGSGNANLDIPVNNGGTGYVAFAPYGNYGTFNPAASPTTQEYAGAQDLDIKPADNTALVQVCRLWVAKASAINGSLYYDVASWTSHTNIYLQLIDPTGKIITSGTYLVGTNQGTSVTATASRTGWYTFNIRSNSTPTGNLKPAYWLKATYTSTQQ